MKTFRLIAVIMLLLCSQAIAQAADKLTWGWSETSGWIDYSPSYSGTSYGMTAHADHLEGYAWGENIGWIRFGSASGGGTPYYSQGAADNWGVNRNPDNTLDGYAWSETSGWINFAPVYDGTPHPVSYNPVTGLLDGYAWGENIGWIRFYGTTATVTATAGSHGSITPPGDTTVLVGIPTSFTITPDTGYHIDTVGGTCGGTLSGSIYTTAAITADCTVSASFAINSYTLTYTAGADGSITGSSPQTVNHGGSGTPVTPLANTGYHFDNWSDGATANPRTDTTVAANISVTANFAINTYTVTPSADSGGTISPNTPQFVNHGGTTIFTITSNPGFSIAAVGGTCGGSLSGNSYTTSAITADCSVLATFKMISTQPLSSAGLIRWYPFDGNANDMSGSDMHGTPYGTPLPAPVPDRLGNTDSAYSFNGSGQYVETPSLTLGGDLTVSVWAKSNTATWNETAFLASARGSWNTTGFIISPWLGTTTMFFYVRGSDSVSYRIESTQLDRNITDYHHYGFTYNSATRTLRAYIDGKFSGELTLPNGVQMGNGSNILNIGRDDYGAPRFGNAAVDDVRVYNRVLSDSEMGTMFASSSHVCNVTYSGNNATSGSAPLDSVSHPAGSSATILGNSGSLTRTGFTFSGWNTASDGSGTTHQPGATLTLGNTGITLYARWIPKPALTVTLAGSGSGTVAGTNGTGTNYSCTSQACPPMYFTTGDSVTLTATPAANVSFTSWDIDSGSIVSNITPYTGLLMDGNRSVVATFMPNPSLVKISGVTTVYYTLISALADCAQGATILARDVDFTGDLTVSSCTITLLGGFPDATFSGSRTGFTTISGKLVITGGKLIVDQVKVK